MTSAPSCSCLLGRLSLCYASLASVETCWNGWCSHLLFSLAFRWNCLRWHTVAGSFFFFFQHSLIFYLCSDGAPAHNNFQTYKCLMNDGARWLRVCSWQYWLRQCCWNYDALKSFSLLSDRSCFVSCGARHDPVLRMVVVFVGKQGTWD